MDRRKFIKSTTALGAVALTASACGKDQESIVNQASTKKFRWRLAMFVPETLPIWADGVKEFARKVEVISGGRMHIKVQGAGSPIPGLEIFDSVKAGTVEMGHAASYYWGGKVSGAEFFTSIPFGMNANGMNSWIYSGGGLQLWQELYAPHNLVPIPCGNTGVQMGGWFNKEINSLADYKGLKMRMPGLGGKVLTRAGAVAETLPAGEIQTALSTGRIDATEWVGPYHDVLMGFNKIAKYYYTGGWHEPGSMLELLINKQKWQELPNDIQEIIKVCAADTNKQMFTEWLTKDAEYLQIIKDEGKVQLREFPMEVVKEMKKISHEVVLELANTNEMTKKIYKSFTDYQKLYEAHQDVTERAYVKYLKS